MHARRWHERLRQAAAAERMRTIQGVQLGLRNAISGTTFGTTYPSRAALIAAGYGRAEDLPDPTGDDVDDARAELERAGIIGDEADTLLRHLGYTISET